MTKLLLTLAIALTGCSVSAGPMVVHSSGLGLESPYVAAFLSADTERFELRARVADARKGGSNQGIGVFTQALIKTRVGKVELAAGSYAAYQSHDLWEKWSYGPAISARHRSRALTSELTLYGPDGDKVNGSIAARFVGNGRVAPLFEVERVRHTQGTGSRVAAGMLWRLGRAR